MKRLVSILGDSISTYPGYNPNGYSIYYDESMQQKNGLKNVYDTWWAKVNQQLKAYLCINNSYSGSKVSGERFPVANCDERIMNLYTNDRVPDIILIYIGFNDFGNGITIRSDNPFDVCTFEGAYNSMLNKIRTVYPSTVVVCGTLME